MIHKIVKIAFTIIVSAIFIMACAASKEVKKPVEAPKPVAEKLEKHPDVDYSISCMECHETETPEQVEEWRSSPHGKMNFGCYMCHGDGVEEFAASPGSERCVSCHSDQEVDFTKCKLDNCFDCHQGHSLQFH